MGSSPNTAAPADLKATSHSGAQRSVLVTGASGFVGGALVQHLATAGRTVGALVRGDRRVSGLPQAQHRTVRTWNQHELEVAIRGFDAVVHAASVVHRPGAPLDEYDRFNREGSEALVAAARATGVRRLVFLSSIKIYGEHPPGLIDESTPPAPDPGYASTKLDAEHIFLDAGNDGGPKPVVLRLCPVYGRGDKGNVRTMMRAISRRRFAIPGSGNTRKSIVHVATVCEAARAAIDSDVVGTFIVADRYAPTIRELSDAIARVLHRSRPFTVPEWLLMLAAGTVEFVATAVGQSPPVSRALIHKSLAPTVCSPARIEAALGIQCHVDLETALQDEAQWLLETGQLG